MNASQSNAWSLQTSLWLSVVASNTVPLTSFDSLRRLTRAETPAVLHSAIGV
jgi:hypothetical protein